MLSKSLLISILVLSAGLLYTFIYTNKQQQGLPVIITEMPSTSAKLISNNLSVFNSTIPKTPVYFLSHGGPTFMYPSNEFPSDLKAHNKVKAIGDKIKTELKPSFILIVSAHWESNADNTIEVGIPKQFPPKDALDPLENELIYDFHGFPDHMYKEKFHTKNDLELATHIKDSLISNGLDSKLTTRGFDHGVWVPLKVAFSINKKPEEQWDLSVPLIQISLNYSDDFKIHKRLGEILRQYRELGGLVICSGMSVHNLRDIGYAFQTGKTRPYVSRFNSLLTNIVTNNTALKRFELLENLKTEHRQLLYSAHPTLEHFMPMVVASGLAGEDDGIELHNSNMGCIGWGIYQFGK